MNKILVVTPTYNEAENIVQFIHDVLEKDPRLDILIVDDNSPDGTASMVKELQKTNSHILLLERPGKMGLGTAYVAGFKFALEKGYDAVFEMDADFSHDPKEIPAMLEMINTCDLVIGSRYVGGVRVLNWPIRRLMLSYGASIYTRFVTGLPVKDTTAGFKCFRRKVLESINLDNVHSNGYAFQIEMSFKTWKKGYSLCEHPIIFMDRRSGVSKMSKKIVYEAVLMVWKLKFQSLIGTKF